jgi:pimeloyl-ACP methyl ester carboxylesterase
VPERHEVHDWEQRVNFGLGADHDLMLGRVGDRLKQIHALHGRLVSLVGWSYGGVYARQSAAKYPELVRKRDSKAHMAVDTLGQLLAVHVTPVNEQERA